MRNLLLFVLAGLPLVASAVVDTTSTIDPGAADSAWSWVGSMSGASAVAIGPRTVLTARHVGAGDFWLNGVSYRVESTLEAPKISGARVDLRVVQLSDVLPGWYQIGTSSKAKSLITMVGYGSAGVVNQKRSGYQVLGGGDRRAGDNRISAHKRVNGYGPVITSMLDHAGEAALAGGDSGGGWFVGDRLVGISSFTFRTKSKTAYGWAKKAYFGSGAVDLTNARVAKWVRGQILDAPLDRAMPVVRAVPEPGSFVALGLGAFGLMRRRAKR